MEHKDAFLLYYFKYAILLIQRKEKCREREGGREREREGEREGEMNRKWMLLSLPWPPG